MSVINVNNVKKIYIGNIYYELDSEDLVTYFGKFGPITDKVVIKDKVTGASRGFGFVTFETPSQATAAVEEMNGFVLESRPLRVKLAEPKRREPNESMFNTQQPTQNIQPTFPSDYYDHYQTTFPSDHNEEVY